jgi:hypothetical protein
MKELVIRTQIDDLSNTSEISTVFAHLIQNTFELQIKSIYTLPFKGRKIIGPESNEQFKAVFTFDYEDYNDVLEMAMSVMGVVLKIQNKNINIPNGAQVIIDLVKREESRTSDELEDDLTL